MQYNKLFRRGDLLMFKKMSIRVKMLLGILPVLVAAMVLLTLISASRSKTIIINQVVDTANADLQANVNSVDSNLEQIRNTAENLARVVGASYKTTDMDTYGAMITDIISDNSSILGSGIWFEPNVYDSSQKYEGPYWTKDTSGNIAVTYDYSNADYDYFNQEYYTNAKAMTAPGAVITDPYYDQTSGKIMASCSAPIFDSSNTYVGCITVDMELTAIGNMVSGIKIGNTGTAMLTTSSGVYIYTSDQDKVTNAANITTDDNASLAAAGKEVIANDSGVGTFSEGGKTYSLFYESVPDVNWKLMIRMAHSEMDAEVRAFTYQMIGICFIFLILCIIVVLLLVSNMSKELVRVKSFAGSLASGDFTVNNLKSRKQDELGQMSQSLNNMYESNRSMLHNISDESERINASSSSLSTMADELRTQFDKIKSSMSNVNDDMMSSGAATEEVNASVEEVNASVQTLAAETEKNLTEAERIKAHAGEIEQKSKISYDNAISIASQREQELAAANDKAQIVDEIGNLANAIAEIADQINLLSLNASIEAARAGEHGRGFAVVASEINKLANDTGEAVSKIQVTVDGVQEAFRTLITSSNELLSFLKDTVTPDYDNFVEVGKQYGKDAMLFGNQSQQVAEMVENIRAAMNEVSSAIQNIAESTQDTASHSSDINDSVNNVSEVVGSVTDMSTKQQTIAKDLDGIVGKFKLK